MTTKKRRQRHKKYLFNELDILIERDVGSLTDTLPVAYTVRVLANQNGLLPPATGIPTFAEAMQCAYMVKKDVERKRKQRFSADCIKVLAGVELFIGKDATLDRFIAESGIVPCDEHIKAFIRKEE